MKAKESLQRTEEKEEALDWSFKEWLEHFQNRPFTSKELDEMENEVFKNKPQNNPYYQPLQGA